MLDFIRTFQLDIMLGLSSICLGFALLLFITKYLERRRKIILIFMEFVATFLLLFDRLSYIYSGAPGYTGYIMIRVSNFFVFFLTPCVVLGFNQYLLYLIYEEAWEKNPPKRIIFVSIASLVEMALVVISQMNGLFYYFDDKNVYHRGPGFLLCYIIPTLCPLIQFTVIQQYRKHFSRLIYTSLVLYIFVPIIMGIIQIFAYGTSIVNMAMVIVSISLYVFTYLDINETAMHAHEHEVKALEEEKKKVDILFDQTARTFMTAIESRDPYAAGHSARVSNIARDLAKMMGKSEAECLDVYYAALLHNIGMVSVPDDVIGKDEEYRRGDITEEEGRIMDRIPVVSAEILSKISGYPHLQETALYCHERFDGNGYPLHLKGQSIPEMARLVKVAAAYDEMMSKKSYRGPIPLLRIREEFIRQAGTKYDPEIAAMMVRMIDESDNYINDNIPMEIEKVIECGKYRDAVSTGIPVIQEITTIRFTATKNGEEKYSMPTILLFDAFDGFVHDDAESIEAYHFIEYAELWFDGKNILTNARNIKVTEIDEAGEAENIYEITAVKYEDHVRLDLISSKGSYEVIIALPDRSKAAYIGLTGENCTITDIVIDISANRVQEGEIEKIVEADSYINRIESDVPNVQVDQYRSDSTLGVLLDKNLKLDFHAMSLPSANLVWHCPYVILYYSDDGSVNGDNYREYAMIKLNGEISSDEGIAKNKFSMKKKDSFPGWDVWKNLNKTGLEYSVSFQRKNNNVIISTENLGIAIDNTTTILDGTENIYVSLSGDQVALTDIRLEGVWDKY